MKNNYLSLHTKKLLWSIPGVPALKDNNNLKTWMLEVTSNSVESKLCVGLMRLHESKRVLIIVPYHFGLFIYLFITRRVL